MRSKHIKISSESFDWAETLQTAAADESVYRIWLLGDTSTGVQGLCNALRQEDCASKIRFTVINTEQWTSGPLARRRVIEYLIVIRISSQRSEYDLKF